ncbi:MAG: hypothetical protein AAGB05_06990 [Pseudomonadota bacterium]
MHGQQTQAKRPSGVRALLEYYLPRIFLRVGEVFGVFWAGTSRHARVFPKELDIPDGPPDALIPVTEVMDHDEDVVFRDVMLGFSGDCLVYEKGDGRKPDHEDKHWGYTKGIVEGELKIDALDALPEECRRGLFTSPGIYDVVARPNFLRDEDKIRVSRLSLKIRTDFDVPNVYAFSGTAQELDLLLSEGLRQADSERGDQDGQGFFFRDARQLRYMHQLDTQGLKALWSLLKKSNGDVLETQQDIMTRALDCLYTPTQSSKNWAEKDYYSAGPYRLGGVLMKFGLRTRQHTAGKRAPKSSSLSHDQRVWFDEWKNDGAPAIFDLCIQIARYGAIPEPSRARRDPCKAIMASEYTDLVWNEKISSFARVGTLTLHAKPTPTDTAPWYLKARERWYPNEQPQVEALRFNAWNTLPDMQPVGQLFRARKQVHTHHRETRLRHTFSAHKNPKAFCPMR